MWFVVNDSKKEIEVKPSKKDSVSALTQQIKKACSPQLDLVSVSDIILKLRRGTEVTELKDRQRIEDLGLDESCVIVVESTFSFWFHSNTLNTTLAPEEKRGENLFFPIFCATSFSHFL